MKKAVVTLASAIAAVAVSAVVVPVILPSLHPVTINAQSSDSEVFGDSMTFGRLEALVNEIGSNVQVNQNQILFDYEEKMVLLVTDSRANRMRLLVPVIEAEKLTGEQLNNMMVANFHTALDSRYAISNGVVYSVFVHPLSSLQDNDFRSAVSQVKNLATSFGTNYSSGTSIFGAPSRPEGTEALPEI